MRPSNQAQLNQTSHEVELDKWQYTLIEKLDELYDRGYRFSIELDRGVLNIRRRNGVGSKPTPIRQGDHQHPEYDE